MGADNWAVCPKCKIEADKKKAAVKKSIDDCYGKVPAEVYTTRLADFNGTNFEPEQTLREYFELGTTIEAEFVCNYRCSCDKCDYKFEFNHSEKVKFK